MLFDCFQPLQDLGHCTQISRRNVCKPEAITRTSIEKLFCSRIEAYEFFRFRLDGNQFAAFLSRENQMATITRHTPESHPWHIAKWGATVFQQYIRAVNQIGIDKCCGNCMWLSAN